MTTRAELPPEAIDTPPRGPTLQRSLVSGGTFAVANAAQRALVFILLPIYTAVLSPGEYGRLGVLITIQSGAILALQAGSETTVLRHFFQLEGDARSQQRFIQSSWNLLLVAAPVAAAIVAAVLFLFIPESPAFRPGEGALAIASAATYVAAVVVPLTVLRAEQRLAGFLLLTGIIGASSTVFTILLLVILQVGVTGWFFGILVANLLALVTAMVVLPWRRLDYFDREGVRASIGLGLSLMPHVAAIWALQLADRLVLSGLVTTSALGVYTLGATLALPALVVIQSLNQGFMPSYARRRNIPGSSDELRDIITIQVLLVVVVGCGLTLLVMPVVGVVSHEYAGAASLVPWLVLGYVFLGLYQIPMNLVSLMAGRTALVWIFSLTATAINLGIIWIFAPEHGVIAAAVASAIGYFTLFALVLGYAGSLRLRVDVAWAKVLAVLAVGGATFVVGGFILPTFGIGWSLVRVVVLLAMLNALAPFSGFSMGALVRRLQARRLALGTGVGP